MASDDPPLWYFGYGSNLCRATFIERRKMQPQAARRARLIGYRLCFDLPVGPGERGVANLAADRGTYVWGALYLLGAADCERLDRSEGVGVGAYRRLPVAVVADGGERIAAFTYESSYRRAGRKPSARYLQLLLDGAREHALPDDWIAFLTGFELAHDERLDGGDAAGSARVR
jgi:gamma-glutamylcyclotransferase